jgi:hypothetical protein
MGGGLMQLVAYGAQDVYLTGNPQITFFKVTYRRHTNFAMESIEQTFNGVCDFGRRVQCTIARNGDLAYRTYFSCVLPEIDSTESDGTTHVNARWLDYPGHNMIQTVEVEIGGQRIDKQYGDWMHIWNQLTQTAEQEAGYNKMIGHTTQLTYLTNENFFDGENACGDNDGPCNTCAPRKNLPETTLYVPLQFWFCRNPGLALPLIALQYHEVKINVELRPLDECLFAVKEAAMAGGDGQAKKPYTQSLVAASLYVDYIFLDTDERRRMAQNPHEYLIEQLQFTGDESVGSSSNKVKLNFNHPCKELVWVVQKDSAVDYCDSFEVGQDLNSLLGAQPFNYTDCLDAVLSSHLAYATQAALVLGPSQENVFDEPGAASFTGTLAGGLTQLGTTGVGTAPFGGGALGGASAAGATAHSLLSDTASYVLATTAHGLHCWGENPCVTAKLQLNGQDRFSEREGDYFDVVQPYQHHTRHPDTGINVYSFALRPEEHQPSGTCNFSRIDNATLTLVLSNNTVGANNTAKVRVYATNYNVLRIMSGMGGLAYSN